ncbi:MAG: NPXTG-anchored protein [Eggerthellaceae bacterium]
MKKLISVITAAAAVAAISATAGAYSINKDLGFGWSTSATIGAEEFANVTPDTTVTITYNVNESLADMDGQNYWCIKPMVNDAGWPFISTLNGAVLSEGGDSYTLEMDSDSMSFTIPADQLELLQTAGMAVMGHGIELLEMTFSDEPVAAPSDSAENAETPTEEPTASETPAETVAPSDSAENAGTPAETTAPTKGNPDTGVSGIAAVAGAAVIAAGVLFTTRRK